MTGICQRKQTRGFEKTANWLSPSWQQKQEELENENMTNENENMRVYALDKGFCRQAQKAGPEEKASKNW